MYLFIPAKKRKRIILALTAHLLLLALSINAIVKTDSMKELIFNGLFNYMIFGIMCLYCVFTIWQLVLVGGREWLNKASIEISDSKITNNLNYYSYGTISFENISETALVTFKNRKYLVIQITNPGEFIRTKPTFSKFLLKKIMKRAGSPFVIDGDSLDYDLRRLSAIIENKVQEKLHKT